ncbi:hypothetical protein N9093_01865, partial [bacterium]|nr:hypothetical protein [bacterium]
MHSYHVVVSMMRSTRRLSAIILFGLAVCAQPCAAIAGGGPENLILIVNADSASSKLLANHYIHGRGIPRSNVIYLEGVPDREI